jgi:tetratricopeptide (TPR) repeat protein
MGKISYASPEQFGGAVDGRSDFYSLGVVLYELLTAAKPITGANTMAIILAHCQTPPRPFSQSDPQGRVPNELRAVVLKALEKNPDDRYQSSEDFSAALEAALPAENRNVSAPSSAPSPPLPLPRTVTLAPLRERLPAVRSIGGSRKAKAASPVTGPTKRMGGPGMGRLALAAAFVAVAAFLTAGLFEMLKERPADPVSPGRSRPETVPVEGQAAGSSIAIVAQKPQPESGQTIIPALAFSPAPDTAGIAPRSSRAGVRYAAGPAGEGQGNAEVAERKRRPDVVDVPPEHPDSSPTGGGHDLAEGDRQRRHALAFSTAHQWPSAIAAWRQFLQSYAGVRPAADHAAYYNLGIAYESLREWQEATDAFEHARLADTIGMDTNNLLHLGRCYGKAGRWGEAASTYESILSIDPANDMARRNLAFARRQEPVSR